MSSVIVCPACDLAHRFTAPPASGRRQCARCRAPLQRRENSSIDTAIALAVSSLVLLMLSNAYPLVAMYVNGSSRETTVIAPLLQIVTLLHVLIPLRRGRRAPGQNFVLRVLTRVRPWNFMEVFML